MADSTIVVRWCASSAGMLTPAGPKVREAKLRGGSQEGFQWVAVGLDRLLEVLKGVRRGPLELSALRCA